MPGSFSQGSTTRDTASRGAGGLGSGRDGGRDLEEIIKEFQRTFQGGFQVDRGSRGRPVGGRGGDLRIRPPSFAPRLDLSNLIDPAIPPALPPPSEESSPLQQIIELINTLREFKLGPFTVKPSLTRKKAMLDFKMKF